MNHKKQVKNRIVIILLMLTLSVFLISGCTNTNTTKEQNPKETTTTGVQTNKLIANNIINTAEKEVIMFSADNIQHKLGDISYDMYGYNGVIPGPILIAEKGSTTNLLFKNNLKEETTIHWHGLRHDIKNDGVPIVSQKPVVPGGQFSYELKFPDNGVYWYHPHIREDRQQDLGLYGLMIVKEEGYFTDVNKEVPIILDDILLDSNKNIVPYGKEYANFALMGRFGNTMLINGVDDYSLEVNKGDLVRFYVGNVANTRIFNLSFSGAKMKLVGGDMGKYEQETFVDSVIIAPAERYIVDVLFDSVGEFDITHINPEKKYSLGKIKVSSKIANPDYKTSFTKLNKNDDVIADIDSFREYFNKEIDYDLVLDLEMGMGMVNNMMADENSETVDGDMMKTQNTMMGTSKNSGTMMGSSNMMNDEDSKTVKTIMGNMMNEDEDHLEVIEWEDPMFRMNSMSTTQMIKWIIRDKKTGKENEDVVMNAKVGDKIKIRIENTADSIHPMQHPIHLHGQRFLVLSEDGIKNTNLVWKETALIGAGKTVEILVDVTNPGEWMMHCHIAEHLESGMMTKFIVT